MSLNTAFEILKRSAYELVSYILPNTIVEPVPHQDIKLIALQVGDHRSLLPFSTTYTVNKSGDIFHAFVVLDISRQIKPNNTVEVLKKL